MAFPNTLGASTQAKDGTWNLARVWGAAIRRYREALQDGASTTARQDAVTMS